MLSASMTRSEEDDEVEVEVDGSKEADGSEVPSDNDDDETVIPDNTQARVLLGISPSQFVEG